VAKTTLDLDHFRSRLLDLEKELTRRLGHEVETARSSGDDQFDAGDLARVDEMKEEYFTLADTDSAILAQVRAALRRIDEGTYGTCGEETIAVPRDVDPVAGGLTVSLSSSRVLEAREGVRTPSA